MIRSAIFALLIGLFGWTLPALAATPLETAQIQACRAVSSFLIFRYEGFQAEHAQRLNDDLAALTASFQNAALSDDALRQQHQKLDQLLRAGQAFGHGEDDMPWTFTNDLAAALREFLTAAHTLDNKPSADIALTSEYLSVQYLYRAYAGLFEKAREQDQIYLGQDEVALVPAIDAQLERLDHTQALTLKPRWRFLRSAFTDMNSISGGPLTLSQRPFAPLIVDRNARLFSNQALQLQL
ncbi:hypothetical protein NVV93_00870 [Pseudomonas sp. LS44]|uniref:hypothetical protein n=1 Tax=Pseudomonas sp. LS44 TaxID=1357074 RepID=UPI00215AACD2|nr:hypothetical protein [Pseudomonas sp. LS44]UVE17987.1 hypothetical protein NVV93_00870 [Pseudomonas sp. LS44]